MGLSHCLLLAAFAGVTLAYAGQYIPKSFYVIDEDGHQSDVVLIRSRRDLPLPLVRVPRGGGNAYATSSADASASSFGDFIPDDISRNLENLAANIAALPSGLGGQAGARSFASASSSSSAGGGYDGGYGNSGYAGGLGAGHPAGYDGPILFSRFGEDTGTGIQASGAAQGPNAAFSSSSTSSKDGKVQYSVQSGKY